MGGGEDLGTEGETRLLESPDQAFPPLPPAGGLLTRDEGCVRIVCVPCACPSGPPGLCPLHLGVTGPQGHQHEAGSPHGERQLGTALILRSTQAHGAQARPSRCGL